LIYFVNVHEEVIEGEEENVDEEEYYEEFSIFLAILIRNS
jgi:hypothetical protein